MIPSLTRFHAKIQTNPENGCWEWTGALSDKGYSRFMFRGHNMHGHRFIYEALVGPIPKNLTIDHLCRNRACVNPSHLEPVTNRENILRGDSPVAHHARQTHCKRGHFFDEGNTYWSYKGRSCRQCALMHDRVRRRHKKVQN